MLNHSVRLIFASIHDNFYFKYFKNIYECELFMEKAMLYEAVKNHAGDSNIEVLFKIFYNAYLLDDEIFYMYDSLKDLSRKITVVLISDLLHGEIKNNGGRIFYDCHIYDNVSPSDFEKYLLSLYNEKLSTCSMLEN